MGPGALPGARWWRLLAGSGLAVGAFVGAFALHVAAGAAGASWLFVAAVVLIYLTATSLPGLAWLLGGRGRRPRWWWAAHGGLALVATGGALWAAAGRQLAWWVPPAAVVLVTVGTASVVALAAVVPGPRPGWPARGRSDLAPRTRGDRPCGESGFAPSPSGRAQAPRRTGGRRTPRRPSGG